VQAVLLALLHELARDDHALTFGVDLDHLDRQVLAHERLGLLVACEPGVRLRHEGVQRPDLDLETARSEAHDARLDETALFHLLPSLERLLFPQRQRPQALLLAVQREVVLVAGERRSAEVPSRDHALHARAELDEHVVPETAHDRAAPDAQRMWAVMLVRGSGTTTRFHGGLL